SWRQGGSESQVGDVQGVGFNKGAARFSLITHQGGEHLIGTNDVVDGHTQHTAGRRIHGGFPQLFRVHLTQTFITLNVESFFRFTQQPLDRIPEVVNNKGTLTTLNE